MIALLLAQVVSAPVPTGTLATKAEVQAAADQAATALANSCPPASVVPPMESVTPTSGVATTCRRSDAVQPRITRASKCTLVSGGTCSGTWKGGGVDRPFPAGTNVVVTYMVENAASQPIICNLASVPTVDGYSIRCWQMQSTTLTIAIVTAGITPPLTSAAPAGTVVDLTGLPAT